MKFIYAAEVPVEYEWFVNATYIIDNYLCRTISLIGVFMNLFFLVVLRHMKLKEEVHDFWCRCFYNFVICLLIYVSSDPCYNYDLKSHFTNSK